MNFSNLEPASSADRGSVFGSSFGTSTAGTTLFGVQPNQQSNTSTAFSASVNPPSSLIVPFGEQKNASSFVFKPITESGIKPDGTGVFGGAAAVSMFGGASVFGGAASNAPVFGETSNLPAFGGQTGSSVSSALQSSRSVFGKNLDFNMVSASGSSGQISNFAPNTCSQMFVTSGSTSASNPFGTSQSSGSPFGTSQSSGSMFGASGSSELFSSNSKPAIPLFGGNTPASGSVPFSITEPVFTQPVFSVSRTRPNDTQLTSSNMALASFPTNSSNIFSTVPICASSETVFRTAVSPSAGSRKRDSNGAMGGGALFGKQEIKTSDSGSDSLSSPTKPLFTLNQIALPSATTSLFSRLSSAAPYSGSSSSSVSSAGAQQYDENKALFGRKYSVTPVKEQGSSDKALFGKRQLEFSNVKSSEPAQDLGSAGYESKITPESRSINPASSEATLGSIRENPASSDAFLSYSSSKLLEDASFDLFKKKSVASFSETNVLFGKPVQTVGALFEKPTLSSSTKTSGRGHLFGKKQSSTDSESRGLPGPSKSLNLIQQNREEFQTDNTKKSLTKWSRGKVVPQIDRKRRELPSSTESPNLKKSKVFEDADDSVSPTATRVRSSSSRMSVEDLTTKNCIVVKDIPGNFNRGPLLRKHFSQFGTITRLQPLATKRAANITFKTHEEALAAKNEGKFIPGCPPLHIFWRASSKPKSPDDKQTKVFGEQFGQLKTKPVPGSVEDELASMAELSSDFQQEESPVLPKLHTLKKSAPVRKRSPSPPPLPPPMLDVDIAKGLLNSIYKAQAKDTAERVAILDARDKLLRLLRGRQQTDLATAKAFVGTCPDMCPEKERYYREDTRRLAVYEVIPSTMTSLTGLKSRVDHIRAVKEYSRSSADQEEPLPHELRPLPVLVATMNYLLSQIADVGEDGKWSEWYDYLWNRTRGIRKDITQQQLCDVQVAELLERCVRFHIFCSERLCEEDMMTFDAKINNENLTKCLQTLKELYADLEKKGVYCSNEAEFRGYMVLMNLNEGDIMREIQQLRQEIRDSPHICFAVQVYNALNTNNYVRFFRLIEEQATFLSACILHRYFNQIRSKALLIIMKAHGAQQKNVVLYPVEEMIRLLCFEDAREVEAFCSHYCLSLKGVDVVLDSKAYTEPEGSLPQTRSQSLIEIKQENVSVGEVINGSPLPPLQLPMPSSSFDEDGVFIMSSDIQEALETSKLFKPKAAASVENTKVARKGRLQFSPEVVKSLARTVILEVIDTTILEIAKGVIGEETDFTAIIMSEVEALTNLVVEETLRKMAQEVYAEQQFMLKKKLEDDIIAQKQRAMNALCDEIVDCTVTLMSKEVAVQQMSLVDAELHRQCIDRCSQQITGDILCEVVDEMLQDVATEVYNVDVLMKLERLEMTEKCVHLLRCRRFLQKWRMRYLQQIRVKRAMLDFPSAPTVTTLGEQINKLVPNRPHARITNKSFYIGERAKLSVESPMDVIQDELHLNVHLSMASARHMLSNLRLWRPLDMIQIVNPQLQKTFDNWKEQQLIEANTAFLQWKLVLSLPRKEASSSEEALFSKWIRNKLCRSNDRENVLKTTPNYEGEILSLFQINSSSQKELGVPIGLCIRCFHGSWTDNEEINVRKKDLLKGSSAVMFVLPCAESLWNKPSQDSSWKQQRKRLHQILKQKPENPAVPLILIVPRLHSASIISVSQLNESLELSDLHRSHLISAVHVAQPLTSGLDHPVQCFGDWTSLLINCLRFAAKNVPVPPKLRVKPVYDYIEDIVIELYKMPVYQDLRNRTKRQLLHQSPNTLLSLYNDVVEHAGMVCASSSLAQMSWPAPEFGQSIPAGQPNSSWNTEAHMCDLYELVCKMRLPCFRYSDMEADDWSVVCQDVWSYVSTVTKKDSGSAKIGLHQQVAELLSRSKKIFNQFCWLANKDGPCEPSYVNMAWTDLIDACIHYKLLSLRTGQISLRSHEEDDDELTANDEEPEEVMVYYQESELEDWEPPQIWIDAMRQTDTAEPGQLKATIDKPQVSRDHTVADSTDMLTEDEGSMSSFMSATCIENMTASKQDNVTSSRLMDLKLLLEQEKAASEQYEKHLESLLQTGVSTEMLSLQNFTALENYVSPVRKISRQEFATSDRQFVPCKKVKKIFCTDETFITSHSHVRHYYGGSMNVNSYFNKANERQEEQETIADCSNSLSISEKVCDLQDMVHSERQASLLFELRLKSLLDSM